MTCEPCAASNAATTLRVASDGLALETGPLCHMASANLLALRKFDCLDFVSTYGRGPVTAGEAGQDLHGGPSEIRYKPQVKETRNSPLKVVHQLG